MPSDSKYTVMPIKYNNHTLPVLLDTIDYKKINGLNKNWKCNQNNAIYCTHTSNGVTKDIFLHELVMKLKTGKQLNKPIVHINRINLDNRRENLIYDLPNKDINKVMKKKKRIIDLPIESGILARELPTYVWYMKPDKTHGERFVVDIGDINWKTTSSKDVPLRDKLDEAKNYLKNLQKTKPNLFEDYSMNGDYTKLGKELLESYYNIIHKFGYKDIKKHIPDNKTRDYLN